MRRWTIDLLSEGQIKKTPVISNDGYLFSLIVKWEKADNLSQIIINDNQLSPASPLSSYVKRVKESECSSRLYNYHIKYQFDTSGKET